MRINLLFELQQALLDLTEPKLCQKGIEMLEYDFKHHEIIACILSLIVEIIHRFR